MREIKQVVITDAEIEAMNAAPISQNNPHTVPVENIDGLQLIYWRGNAASGKDGADRVELQQLICGHGHITLGTFDPRRDVHTLDRQIETLKRAYAAGRESMQRDIRRLLGVS